MISQTRNSTYKYLAEFFDLMFGAMDDVRDVARQAVVGPILSRVKSACDLACGTGSTALKLAQHGIRTTAVDLSPGMCRLARQKARRAAVAVRVIRADMRSFRLPERVDLVTCEFDALNHVEHKEDLAAVAKSVARALRPGGWFYFDANNKEGFKRYWKGTLWSEKPGIVMVGRYDNDARNDRAWANVEWFIRDKWGCWKRRHERVQEVCWSAREIRTVLKKAGFECVRALDASPFYKSSIITPGCRTLYLARKAP